ncbi:hypothetical protein JOE30_001649 [Rhodococcus sp. PvP016]|uniref:Uncharacterized protein n=1 Tax=Rhodococcoides corynebacterioides TaxID=53972 RepID=A0ABS2KN43_9NOCA|nr:hypothetical protein [Rhodococcus corynebacterioides]MBP1115852.1 hypothetical protein [Rhodococcus sp. PvP016]
MGAGRSMGEGWIAVDERAVRSNAELMFWIDAVRQVDTTPRRMS